MSLISCFTTSIKSFFSCIHVNVKEHHYSLAYSQDGFLFKTADLDWRKYHILVKDTKNLCKDKNTKITTPSKARSFSKDLCNVLGEEHSYKSPILARIHPRCERNEKKMKK
eukprot:TRINITY_DN4169_c2_g1_i1.p1 TRINITY_DN4169_c2_g1~~TRINITY_DN4169_c2_g1_i1.p1  ORF type:complete len:111 (-),score=2.15 TRINITY_DN4169_c2_g1_i1:1479-1811(-)